MRQIPGMADIGCRLDRDKLLRGRMFLLGIREEDIAENFIRSGGPGGQNVNKVSSCVYLKHIPSGIEVKCQEERSQAANRYRARVILCDKIEKKIRDALNKKRELQSKARSQRRRRSPASKLRILEQKRRHSYKKKMRQMVRDIE